MKEAYFTDATIRAKAQQMLDQVRHLRDRHSTIAFDASKAALLVLDMQEYFLDAGSHAHIPAAQAILPDIRKLIHAFKQMDRPVVFTRHMNTIDNARMMAIWWKDLIGPESPLGQITGALDTSACQVFEKLQYDAFHETEMESYLRNEGVEQILITGVMTHLCCETTARSAFMRGFEVFFAVDGTATYSEAFHRASLLNLSHGFALPVLAGEILEDMRP